MIVEVGRAGSWLCGLRRTEPWERPSLARDPSPRSGAVVSRFDGLTCRWHGSNIQRFSVDSNSRGTSPIHPQSDVIYLFATHPRTDPALYARPSRLIFPTPWKPQMAAIDHGPELSVLLKVLFQCRIDAATFQCVSLEENPGGSRIPHPALNPLAI